MREKHVIFCGIVFIELTLKSNCDKLNLYGEGGTPNIMIRKDDFK